jgi:hypothetical protein
VRLGTAFAVAGWVLCAARLAADLMNERDGMTGQRFKREKKLYHLQFEAEDLAGFECYATGTTLEQFVEVTALSEELQTPEGRTKDNIEKQFTVFARFLKSWNLDDENDQPVPCTYEGLASQEFDFVMAIMMAWTAAIASVPAPLAEGSASGETSPEASLHLASQSESLAS